MSPRWQYRSLLNSPPSMDAASIQLHPNQFPYREIQKLFEWFLHIWSPKKYLWHSALQQQGSSHSSLYLVLVLQLLSLPPKDWIPNHLALKASRLCITRQIDFHFLAFLKILFIYLFLPVLDLPCCVCAFSSCREWRLLSRGSAWASHCCGFSCCRARALGNVGFSSRST